MIGGFRLTRNMHAVIPGDTLAVRVCTEIAHTCVVSRRCILTTAEGHVRLALSPEKNKKQKRHRKTKP
jgi:hypothetical protein